MARYRIFVSRADIERNRKTGSWRPCIIVEHAGGKQTLHTRVGLPAGGVVVQGKPDEVPAVWIEADDVITWKGNRRG